MTWRLLTDPRVASRRIPPRYSGTDAAAAVAGGVLDLGVQLGWAGEHSALEAVIPAGSRVLLKPNWVMHRNRGSGGTDELVTHPSVIRAVTKEVLACDPSQVIIGDAPLQTCDFPTLAALGDLAAWSRGLAAGDARFVGIRDFRRTVSTYRQGVLEAHDTNVPLDRFIRFDLGAESLLEPISEPGRFRVTMYNPSHLSATHAPGRHQYLIAREIIDADVVVNLPKLKTHKKAGVTCALKNLIGINGSKEFLPHHRIGGAASGGDCYPGNDPVKRALEAAFDRFNAAEGRTRHWWHSIIRLLERAVVMGGDNIGVEGAWWGNDTIWRTCLDLNRILLYGRPDGTLAGEPQRRVISIVDAVIAGQGDGPLAPEALPLGLLLAGESSAAVDHVGALLLGYDPTMIPIAHHAFDRFSMPLVAFAAREVELVGDLGAGRADDLLLSRPVPTVKVPVGWQASRRG